MYSVLFMHQPTLATQYPNERGKIIFPILDKDTEAQRGDPPCLRSHSQEEAEPRLTPGSQAPELPPSNHMVTVPTEQGRRHGGGCNPGGLDLWQCDARPFSKAEMTGERGS